MKKRITTVIIALAVTALLTACGRESSVRKSVNLIIRALETNDSATLSELAPFLAGDTTGPTPQINKNLKKILAEDYIVRFDGDDKAVLVFRGETSVLLGMTKTDRNRWVLQSSVLFNQTIDIIEKASE